MRLGILKTLKNKGMEEGIFKPGDKVIFNTMEMGDDDWGEVDRVGIYSKDGEEAEIIYLVASTFDYEMESLDEEDDVEDQKNYEYYDIKFEDGQVFEGISGYHLKLSNRV
jgi:hypothetical protein